MWAATWRRSVGVDVIRVLFGIGRPILSKQEDLAAAPPHRRRGHGERSSEKVGVSEEAHRDEEGEEAARDRREVVAQSPGLKSGRTLQDGEKLRRK